MIAELVAAIRGCSANSPINAILLEGEGAAFCSGFDLSLCRENSDALDALLTGLAGVIRVMRRCEIPIVIAAHGAAIAGGCALLAGADVVITHHDSKIGYPVVRLGISPAVSAATFRLAVGDGKARERMLDTALMSGWDAFRAGLAHECLEDAGKVRDRALAIAEQLAAKPRHGLIATKKWLGEIDGSFGPDSARALDASLALVGTPEERERLAALWKS
jgi:enoyl-CoA hydratase/carnithine racemase